jgi:hypothetical protein
MHVRPVKIAKALKFYKKIYNSADPLQWVSAFSVKEEYKDYLDSYL